MSISNLSSLSIGVLTSFFFEWAIFHFLWEIVLSEDLFLVLQKQAELLNFSLFFSNWTPMEEKSLECVFGLSYYSEV